MTEIKKYIVSCNGIYIKERENSTKYIKLNHSKDDVECYNVKIKLLKFTTSKNTINDRKRDLLEIAGYVFAADRKCSRGCSDNVEMHSWSRNIELHIKVRDLKFWNNEDVKKKLNDALSFMTGDLRWSFIFHQHEGEIEEEFFGDETFVIENSNKTRAILFSGGLDSLSGIIEVLETTKDKLCLVSHQSGNPSVKKVQNDLFKEINILYPDRCLHYKYECGLVGRQRADESQRTRSFVFNSIAFTLSTTYGLSGNTLFENGITSFNLPETQDMMNSRSSRTTHPKTLGLMSELLTIINEKPYEIKNSYYNKTKTDVVNVLKKYHQLNLMDISVSCSATRDHRSDNTHCGICSQCIDRRIAAYSAEIERHDENGLYDFDFTTMDLINQNERKAISDYLNQAKIFKEKSLDGFYNQFMYDLIDLEEFMLGETEEDNIETIYNLCSRHGSQVEKAIGRMIKKHDAAFSKFRPNSLYGLILGIRNKGNSIELVQIKQNGEKKQELPNGQLTKIAARKYTKAIEDGLIDYRIEETKKEKAITSIIIPIIEKEYILKTTQRRSLHEYFRKRRIEARKTKGNVKVVTHKN